MLGVLVPALEHDVDQTNNNDSPADKEDNGHLDLQQQVFIVVEESVLRLNLMVSFAGMREAQHVATHCKGLGA